MSWVHDHCDDAKISAINERRARGVVALHACEPPCPRKVTAMKYLATLPAPEVLWEVSA